MERSLWFKNPLHIFLFVVLFLSISYSYAWQKLFYRPLATHNMSHTIVLVPGTSLLRFTQQLHQAGLLSNPRLLRWYAVIRGHANNIQAGEYAVLPGMTAIELLNSVVAGKIVQYPFTIIEGWKTVDILAAMRKHPKVKYTLDDLSDAEIIARLAIAETNLEGLFLADTYYVRAGTTDVEFLQRVYADMQNKLQSAWENRADDCVLTSPYEALILASIIEKETRLPSEYQEISGVYQRRLKQNMRLQADPTVIYALGLTYQGQLTRENLRFDSAYNTYLNFGLPPTPIATPSLRALEAAMHPSQSKNLYFVADGKGGHVFSADLVGHNEAVKQFRE